MNKSTTGPKKVVKTKRSLMEFLRKRTTKNYRIAVIAWIGFGENNALNPVWNVVPNIVYLCSVSPTKHVTELIRIPTANDNTMYYILINM